MMSRFGRTLPPRTAWSIFGAAILTLMLLWLLPLSVVMAASGMGRAGFAARTVDGTAWAGRLHDASFKGARLGDVQLSLSALDLLFGTARFRLESLSGGPVSGEGYFGLSGAGLRNVDARLTLGPAFQGLGMRNAQVSSLTAAFNAQGCREASGQATIYVAQGALAKALGPQLSGPATCAAGVLSFRVTDPEGKATVSLEFPPNSRPRYTMLLPLNDSLDRDAVKALGFTETPVGFRWSGVLSD